MLQILRRSVIAALLGITALAAAAPGARADAAAEAFVQENATRALSTLSAPGLSAAQRQQHFAALMDQFADMPRIANFVLGRHAAQLRADAALRRDWNAAFRTYAVAVYQAQLDRYRGRDVRVTGSEDTTVNGRFTSVVSTEIDIPGQSPFRVQWRIERKEAGYQVLDVAVRLDGGTVWLAQQQRRDFLAELDRNGGDIRALISVVNRMTSDLNARSARG